MSWSQNTGRVSEQTTQRVRGDCGERWLGFPRILPFSSSAWRAWRFYRRSVCADESLGCPSVSCSIWVEMWVPPFWACVFEQMPWVLAGKQRYSTGRIILSKQGGAQGSLQAGTFNAGWTRWSLRVVCEMLSTPSSTNVCLLQRQPSMWEEFWMWLPACFEIQFAS